MSAPSIDVRVRNFLGVAKADLRLQGIVLVAGRNGSGKSSLLESVAAVATATLTGLRGVKNKKGAADLVREGADIGSVTLDYGTGQFRLTVPEAKVDSTGKPVSFGSALGIGSQRFSRLKPEDRAREIVERFNANPALADVVEWFRDHPEGGISEETAGLLFEQIEEQGWDVTARKSREHGTKLKGRWEAISGRSFGSKLAETWAPSDLLPGEEYDLEAARADVSAAKTEVERLLKQQAASQGDIARLQEVAAAIENRQAEVKRLSKEADELSQRAEELLKEREGIEVPTDTTGMPTCPHCGKKIELKRAKGTSPVVYLAKPPARSASDKEIAEARMKIANCEGDQANVKIRIAANSDARAVAQQKVLESENAKAQLAKLAEAPPDGDIDGAREILRQRERRADQIDAYQKARSIFADWTKQGAIIAAVDPDGIRQHVLKRRLAEFNEKLGATSATAKFSAVGLTDALDITYDGRDFALLSESEQWRCDLVLTVTLARQEGARLLLVDRLDVLDPPSRPGVLLMLRDTGIPALVAMMAKEPGPPTVPDLAKAKIGSSRWIEKGVLSA